MTAWKKASVLFDNLRAEELSAIDTTQGLLSLLPAFNACVKERELSLTSGLIEQQKIFSRAYSK